MSDFVAERFADIEMLRYRLKGFERLTARQRAYIYCLSEAALSGRDITTAQFGRDNITLRKVIEAIYTTYDGDRTSDDFRAFTVYLKRIWFANGIHHHYGSYKFPPGFSEDFFRGAMSSLPDDALPLKDGETREQLTERLVGVVFDESIQPMRTNKRKGDDLVLTSSVTYYEGVTQEDAERYYSRPKRSYDTSAIGPPSHGLNTRLLSEGGCIKEQVCSANGLYAAPIRHIVAWLEQAKHYAENERQRNAITLLIDYYVTGDVRTFDRFSVEWVQATEGEVDFINGFIEVYSDPLGIKGSWEGFVSYKDAESTERAATISRNAQWFEDHSPVAPQFKKQRVCGVTANVVCAAMLGGDEYPSSAIGINLPNADWIRAEYGSKSVTICNLTEAYDRAAHGNGFREEFVIDKDTYDLIERYGDLCDDLHTDLHECLGHGSGRLLDGVSPNALGEYGNAIEEARADLFALYYIADDKLVELALLPDGEAYKSQYYTYMMNGLLTQLTRIEPGHCIEEAHMRNRAMIARWVLAHAEGAVEVVTSGGKSYVRINDYVALRALFARLLAEIQRVKSEGDYDCARYYIETYATHVEPTLHAEIRRRYAALNLAPYKGFINPRLMPVRSQSGDIIDVTVDYSETYEQQMLRYSKEYGFL